MADIFISSAVRTAIGSFGGSLSGLSLSELATHVGKEAINRAGIAPDKIEQTVFGNVIHTEPRDMYLSRVAAINSGSHKISCSDLKPSLWQRFTGCSYGL